MRLAASLAVAVTALAGAAQAQEATSRGAAIATQGVGDSVPACAPCHAANGIADGSGAFPRLAGQSAYYLGRQMADYASGLRTSVIMGPIAQALSADDRSAVVAYFAAARGPYLLPRRSNASLVERGRQLARSGDLSQTLPACNNCHGPGGTGEFPAIPYLAGQYAEYTSLQLQLWKTGARKTSAESMGEIARRLSAQDIAAVAAYYQQLREAAEK